MPNLDLPKRTVQRIPISVLPKSLHTSHIRIFKLSSQAFLLIYSKNHQKLVYISESSTSVVATKLGNAMLISLNPWNQNSTNDLHSNREHYSILLVVTYFRYGNVMFLINDGYFITNSLHSSSSIFPSPFMSASLNVCTKIPEPDDYFLQQKKKKTKTIKIRGVQHWAMKHLFHNCFNHIIRKNQL